MADNNENNIKQITDLLNRDGVAETLKKLIGNLGSAEDNQHNKKPEEKVSQNADSKNLLEDTKIIQNMARAMSEIKKADDSNVNLLSALKPFLNEKRQKICGDCTRILKMKKVFEFMNEHGEDFNF